MAKQRVVKTTFRSDSYIEDLEPLAKLLFVYLITNDAVDLSGIYELSMKKICYESSIDREKIKELLATLQEDGKIYYHDGRVIITNFIKNQNWNSPKIKKGIERSLQGVPEGIWLYLADKIPYLEKAIPYIYRIAPYFTLPYLTIPNLTLPIGITTPNETVGVGVGLVRLSAKEKEELEQTYGVSVVSEYIRKLEAHIGSKGDNYKSHYYTLLSRFDKYNIRPLVNKVVVKEEEKQLTPEGRNLARAALSAARKKINGTE